MGHRVRRISRHEHAADRAFINMQTDRHPQCESDQRLELRVQRALTGDQTAFSEIYGAYSPKVRAYIQKRVGGFSEVEDLTQETFVQLYRSLGSYEGRSSLLTWTFGIAHNVCSRYYRQCSRWMIGAHDARPLEEMPIEATIEQEIDAARLLERCDRTLERSRKPTHREIFQLRYAENQSIRSIAKKVGRSSDAVKVSLRQSRAVLFQGVPELDQVVRRATRKA